MKTRTRKTTRVLCASAIAMMTLLSSAAPAFAVNAGPTEDEAQKVKLGVDNNYITFDKKIYAEEGENAPDVTISYTLFPRTVKDDKEKEAFAANGYDNVVTGKEGLTASDTPFTTDDLLAQGQNYFKQTSTINASSLLTGLTKPTVFTYTLKEDVPENAQGFITTDKGTTRKLNIYVGYKDDAAESTGTLSVLYATLAQEDGTKAVGFENNYDTQAIHLTKKVTGNQGDKTKKFTFTVNIANQYSKVTASGVTTNLDNTKLMPNDSHNVSFTVDLANDETLDLTGLSKGATYTVTEDKGTYTQTVTVDNETPEKPLTDAHTINGDADTVVFTNTKEGKIPTGIYLNHKLPFNIAGIAILGGAISLFAKKRHDALEEDDDE
ncbi:DUF7601 domain-containing protein [Intestinibaculum porci]|uniref:DUF7601 domain-containing protein n=1 Tax=Intestinibaculum porci TaxID=2487118 RepID=UPI00240A5EB4|nr:hypothetical protein [Intestinibaculum porci]MDD6350686.1 hypothetical protein [Intestinibaculum porci]